MTMLKTQPLGDRCVVKQDKAATTQGGIYLPETAQDAPQWGTIVAVGKGKLLDNGQVRPMSVKQGDRVIFGKYSGTKMKVDSEELLFMREDDIMAVVED